MELTNNKKRVIFTKFGFIFFLVCMILTGIIIIYFLGFIFYKAYPAVASQGLINFITGSQWNYGENIYGIRVFIVDTTLLTLLTLVLSVPVSIFTAIFLSEFASKKLVSVVRPMIELLVGIPSVVYGIFGIFILENLFQNQVNPLIDSYLGFIPIFHDSNPSCGDGLLLASTVLAVMVLPTIISISEDSMRAVPYEYREASFSLGANSWETVRHVVLPAASKGILSAVILGMMRAMGETMAVVMLIGNVNVIPGSIFGYGYPMTSKILNDVGFYMSEPDKLSALFGIAAALFTAEILSVALARKLGAKK